ncbi:phenolic acid decarboxylase [Actinopolyspora biskrensis]|uniref:Phenolic acid decarboxylase n=1 Tax=Actinopolyspora biskrensis TaxID=1470178 RepID=A0A852ZF80_9ACTN|nr:phenolic acid decarboxylase [Actinopolyspora biskrensis]NYH80623.1 phenolic acid decarboxylase [Actinopolyspora biskrensis]
MTAVSSAAPPQDLTGILGKHFIYTYDNGWRYEMYVKNSTTIDYRIHSGMVGGRWVKDQPVDLVRLGENSYKVSWNEPTGTSVSVNVLLAERRLHGVIFFPRWVHQHPERTVCFQNDHLDEMTHYRDQGPTYPIYTVPEFAAITFLEDRGENDEHVVAKSPEELPEGYAARVN